MRIVCVLLTVVSVVRAVEHYVTLNDHYDYEAVIKIPSEFKKHVDCYLSKGPCDELLESFRQNIQAGVHESCARCNSAKKHLIRVFLDGLKKVLPEEYKEFRQYYDPTGEHFDKLEAAIAGY